MLRLLAPLSLLGLLAACSDEIDDSCPTGTVRDGKVCAQPSGGAAGSGGGGGAGGAAGGSGVGGVAGAAGVGGAGGAAGQAGGASPGGASGGGGVSGASGSSGGGTAGGAGLAGTGGIAQGGGAGLAGAGGQAGGAGAAAGTGGTGAGGPGSAGKAGGSTCGNGSVDGVEQCDGKDLGGKKNCTTIAPGTTGPLGCTKDCTFDTSQCVATKCGDGKVEGAEECDGTLDPSVTCSDLLGANYASDEKPYCSSKCKVDYLSCKPLDGHIGPPLLPMELGGIQATEVTRAQYAQFLQATQGMALPTPPECGGNSTMPNTSCLQDATVCNEPGTACARHPQVCVDFCDAKAFCAFGGRHVCGGPGGTPIGLNAGFSSDDLWFNACASGGAYFYGEEFEPGRCNTAESGIGSTVPVGSLAQCRSGYAPYSSIADMFGNVDEWENSSCQLNVIGQLVCAVRGNSFLEPHSAGGCFGAYRLEGIVTTLPSVGFRCCD